jgi:hypothetical protein
MIKEKAATTRRINMAEKSQKAVLYARAKAISNGTAHLLQEILKCIYIYKLL